VEKPLNRAGNYGKPFEKKEMFEKYMHRGANWKK
jgi:hypothetical protein